MIHYQLQCVDGHGFDGWFPDSASFEMQAKAGFVSCPECGGTQVSRGLMAPAVRTSRRAAAVVDESGQDVPAAPSGAKAGAKSGAGLPDQVRGALQRLRAEVEKNCENVGGRFAEEALAMHRGEREARGIYGDSTPEQAEKLAEQGVPVARIP